MGEQDGKCERDRERRKNEIGNEMKAYNELLLFQPNSNRFSLTSMFEYISLRVNSVVVCASTLIALNFNVH